MESFVALHEVTSISPYDITTNVSATFDGNTSVTMSPSMHTAMEVARVLEFKITPVVCIVGIVLNIISLLVLTERGLRESPYTYLRVLSCSDFSALVMTIVFLFTTSPAGPSSFITSDGTTGGDFGVYYGAYVFFPLTSICNNASTWIIIMLTIERFLLVKTPLWARDACSPSRARIKIAIVLGVVTLANLPRFTYYTVVRDAGPGHLLQIRATPFRYSQANTKVLFIYSVVFGVVPLVILSAANTYLVYAVKRARRERRLQKIRNNMEAHWNREQTQFTWTLISIVLLAVICILPAAFGDVVVLAKIISASDSLPQFIDSPFYKVYRSFCGLMLTFNMTLNFVLYSAFKSKFGHVMRNMFRRWIQRVTGTHPNHGVICIGDARHRAVGVKTASNSSLITTTGHCWSKHPWTHGPHHQHQHQQQACGHKAGVAAVTTPAVTRPLVTGAVPQLQPSDTRVCKRGGGARFAGGTGGGKLAFLNDIFNFARRK